MYNMGEEDMPPQPIVVGVADQMGGTMLAFGILGALFHRERTGKGQKVDASLLGAMLHAQAMFLSPSLLLGGDIPRRIRSKMPNPMVSHFQCADGKWIMFSMFTAEKFWHNFCEALGIEHLKNVPKFNSMDARKDNCEELNAIIDEAMMTKASDEWVKIFDDKELTYTIINRLSDLHNDPQTNINNYIIDFEHPTLNQVKFVGFPVQFSETPAEVTSPAPELGQHTEEVLHEFAGYTWDEIERLREEGVI
jgi:crotonobetainyl-CoA:carnitine CoA-transferase CaiB-like acyl-CoA transferase